MMWNWHDLKSINPAYDLITFAVISFFKGAHLNLNVQQSPSDKYLKLLAAQ